MFNKQPNYLKAVLIGAGREHIVLVVLKQFLKSEVCIRYDQCVQMSKMWFCGIK